MISCEVPSRNGKNPFQDEAQLFKKEHVLHKEVERKVVGSWSWYLAPPAAAAASSSGSIA
jgi:nitric oxide synthase oxygenase domain/subunit